MERCIKIKSWIGFRVRCRVADSVVGRVRFYPRSEVNDLVSDRVFDRVWGLVGSPILDQLSEEFDEKV